MSNDTPFSSMTLRDYLAAQCLERVGSYPEPISLDQADSPDFYKYCTWAARAAYLMADTMLIERDKNKFKDLT